MTFERCLKGTTAAETTCAGCAAPVADVLFRYVEDERESFIYRCPACGLMYANPVLIPQLNDRQMDSVDDAELFNSALMRELHVRINIDREISSVRKILGRKDFSLLDIGCGTGWTSNIWQGSGARVTGLEPSAVRGELAHKRYGFRVIPCYVEELENDEIFDVVTMRHVIEHFETPRAVLEKVGSHLSENGLLVVVVPNINCIGRYLFQSKWSWILPWHCIFFSPASLAVMLEHAGYEVVTRYQTPSPLWYPESFFRRFPRFLPLSRLFDRVRALSILVFAPIVVLGYLTGFSDNITIIARPRKRT